VGADASRVVTPATLAVALGGVAGSLPASETVAGIAEIATQAEVDAGLDDGRIVSPLKLAPLAGRVTGAETSIATLQGDVTALDGRLDTAEANITNLQAADTALDSRLDTAEASIVTLNSKTNLATEATAGIAEIATTAETNTGTDDSRIITPAKLSAYVASHAPAPPSATESIAGVAEIATQAEANAGMDDVRFITALKLNNRLASPVVSAFNAQTSAGSVYTGARVDIANWTEVSDAAADFNPVTGVFTARYTGKYRFSFSLLHDTTITAGSRWTIWLVKNGTTYAAFSYHASAADFNSIGSTWFIELTASDTVKLQIERASGTGNFVLWAEAAYNWFAGELIGGISGIMGSGGFASQLEANAGTVADKALSPATLCNFTGTIAGPVGIGSVPTVGYLFDVKQAASTFAKIETTTATNDVGLVIKGSRQWNIVGLASGTFEISDITAGLQRLSIDNAGNVGIGGAAIAGITLHIFNATDAMMRAESTSAGYAGLQFQNTGRLYSLRINPSNNIELMDHTAGAARLTIGTAGQIGIGIGPNADPGQFVHTYSNGWNMLLIQSGGSGGASAGVKLNTPYRNWQMFVGSSGELLFTDGSVSAVRAKIDTAGKFWCVGGSANIGAI
jgi:C1q domain